MIRHLNFLTLGFSVFNNYPELKKFKCHKKAQKYLIHNNF